MLFLSRLRIVTGGFPLVAAVLALGWTCAPLVSADDANEPGRRNDARDRPAEAPEAEFIFRGAGTDNKSVSLVVAGTSAPVLRLPVKDNLQVLIGGRQVGVGHLQPGSRVRIRLDSTDSVIRNIWAKEPPETVTVAKGVGDPSQLDPPSTREVLRALSDGLRGGPHVPDALWEEVSVVIEPLTRQVDPPRLFPLVGKAVLHHCHWKCTVYFTEAVEPNDRTKGIFKRPRVEVVYIDKDYLVPAR